MTSHQCGVVPLDPARLEKAFEAYSEAENTLKGIEAAILSYIGGDHKPWSDKAYEAFASHFPRPEALKKELIKNRDAHRPQRNTMPPTQDQIAKLIRGHCSVRVQGEDHPVRDGVDSAANAIAELIRKAAP